MSSKPTLRDIAEATGVSTASVSMILNGKSLERFSSQRVASVLAEAERIGYRTPSDRCSACRPSRTRHRHLAGRGPAAKALVAPTGAKSSVGDYPAAVLR